MCCPPPHQEQQLNEKRNQWTTKTGEEELQTERQNIMDEITAAMTFADIPKQAEEMALRFEALMVINQTCTKS